MSSFRCLCCKTFVMLIQAEHRLCLGPRGYNVTTGQIAKAKVAGNLVNDVLGWLPDTCRLRNDNS